MVIVSAVKCYNKVVMCPIIRSEGTPQTKTVNQSVNQFI